MVVRITTTGRAGFARLSHALHEAGEKDLKKELDRGCRDAGKVIVDAVAANTDKYIPRGFEKEFGASLRTRVEVRVLQSRRATAVFWADGNKGNRRKIEEMNAGTLRHPVFGRTRPLKRHWIHKATSQLNPWVDQAIKPGLVDEPATEAMPEAVGKLDDALARVITKIESRT